MYKITFIKTNEVISIYNSLSEAEGMQSLFDAQFGQKGNFKVSEIKSQTELFESIMDSVFRGHKDIAVSNYKRLDSQEKSDFINWLEANKSAEIGLFIN